MPCLDFFLCHFYLVSFFILCMLHILFLLSSTLWHSSFIRCYSIFNVLLFLSRFTALPDVTDNFLDKNSNQNVGTGSSQEVDSLNNLTSSLPNNSNLSLDQNLNLTLSTKPSPGEGLSPSTPLPQLQPLRPPSLSVLSPLNKPDPTEVDDEAPVTSDSSPDSNLIPSQDICVDPDLLNGNMNSKLSCETNNTIITWVKHYRHPCEWPVPSNHQSLSSSFQSVAPFTELVWLTGFQAEQTPCSFMSVGNSSGCSLLCIMNLMWLRCSHFNKLWRPFLSKSLSAVSLLHPFTLHQCYYSF